LKECFYNVC